MKTPINYAISLLISAFLFSSCTLLQPTANTPDSRIDHWLEKNEYDRALAALDKKQNQPGEATDLTNTIQSVKQQRQQFIQRIQSDARQFEKTLDWVNAEAAIDRGLKKAPSSESLRKLKSQYTTLRENRIKMDEASILISKAQYLIAALPYQRSLTYNENKGLLGNRHLSELTKEAELVSNDLYAVGAQYAEQEHWTQAKHALILSVQTADNENSQRLLDSILKTEKKTRALSRSDQTLHAEKQLAELETMFYESIQYEDYFGAQKVLNEISALDITDTAPYQQSLSEYKNAKENQLIDSGNTAFNAGDIEKAAQLWQQALTLNPNNQAVLQQLDKAKTFIDNVERWQTVEP